MCRDLEVIAPYLSRKQMEQLTNAMQMQGACSNMAARDSLTHI